MPIDLLRLVEPRLVLSSLDFFLLLWFWFLVLMLSCDAWQALGSKEIAVSTKSVTVGIQAGDDAMRASVAESSTIGASRHFAAPGGGSAPEEADPKV